MLHSKRQEEENNYHEMLGQLVINHYWGISIVNSVYIDNPTRFIW